VSELNALPAEARAIEEARTVPEVAAVIGKLEALHTLAKQVGLQHEEQNRIAAAKLQGKRKGGQLLGGLEKSDGGRPPENVGDVAHVSEYQETLEEAGLKRREAVRWQQIARIPEPLFDGYIESILYDPEGEITTSGVLAYAQPGETAARLVESNENEWYTPARYIEAARAVLGDIDLDPASSETANETVKAPQIFTLEDNGLAQVWHGRVWLNPPYGRLAAEFITKLIWDHQTENVTAAVALVNAHCTDTSWFQQLWDYALCFTDHRIDFDSGGRTKTTTSTHGSVFAYLGPDPQRFAKEFGQFGAILRRWP
jgi:phage N-6-adenine-methyltransferase